MIGILITGPILWTPSGINQSLLKHMQWITYQIRDGGLIYTSWWVHMQCLEMAFSEMMSRLKQGYNMLCSQASKKFQTVMWQQCCPNPPGKVWYCRWAMELKRIKTSCHYHLTKSIILKNGLSWYFPNQSERAQLMMFPSMQWFIYSRHAHVQGNPWAPIFILTPTHWIHHRVCLAFMKFMGISRFIWRLFWLILVWFDRWIGQLLNF